MSELKVNKTTKFVEKFVQVEETETSYVLILTAKEMVALRCLLGSVSLANSKDLWDLWDKTNSLPFRHLLEKDSVELKTNSEELIQKALDELK